MRWFAWHALCLLVVYLASESRVEMALVDWNISVRTLQNIITQFYHNSCSYQFNVSASCGYLVRQFLFSLDNSQASKAESTEDDENRNYHVCCDLWTLNQCLRNGLYESGCEYTMQRNLTNFTNPEYFNRVFGQHVEIGQLCRKYPEKSTNCMDVSSLVVTIILAVLTIFFSCCFLAILLCMFI